MIDTVKIFTTISSKIYKIISSSSCVKTSYSRDTGEVFYEITTDSLEGSYSSSLSVRVMSASVYGFLGYVLIVEGSYHKIMKGQNAYDGYSNLQEVALGLIKLVENAYKIKLPTLRHWGLQRVDVTNCYDLFENSLVCRYINNLAKCKYPRRKVKVFDDESIYCSGRATTLKIYNKLLEFKKNDFNKLKILDFDVITFMNKIKGFVRFECEIKKRKLTDYFKKKFIRVTDIKYDELEKIWSDEFMKLLKLFNTDLEKIKDKNAIEDRLFMLYGKRSGRTLYNFYLSLMIDGFKECKNRMSSSNYYDYLNKLKKANIDLSQSYSINFEAEDYVNFNPFTYEKVV